MSIYGPHNFIKAPHGGTKRFETGIVREASLIDRVTRYSAYSLIDVARISPDRFMHQTHASRDAIDEWIARLEDPQVLALPPALHQLQLAFDFPEFGDPWIALHGAKYCASFLSAMHVDDASELVGRTVIGYIAQPARGGFETLYAIEPIQKSMRNSAP